MATLTDEKTNMRHHYHFMTFILACSGLVILMSMFITIPLTTIFVTDLNISTTEAVWIGSSFSLCYAISCLIYGPLSDKYGRKIFLSAGISLLTVTTFALGFVENLYVIFVLRALQGIAAAAYAPVSLVYVAEIFPPKKRITTIGFITSGFLMASVVAQVYGLIIESLFGWNAIFISLGIIYFICAILVIFYLPKAPIPQHEVNIWQKFVQMKDLMKNKSLCFSYIMTVMHLFSLVGMYTILGSYLSEKFGFTDQEILIVRSLGIISMIVALFAGRISDRIGVLTSARSGMAIVCTSLFIMGVSSSSLILIICSLIFVAGIALVVPVNISLINENAGSARGSAVLLNGFILFLGASIGPILATTLLEFGNHFVAFSVFSLILLGGFICSLFIKRPQTTVHIQQGLKVNNQG